MFSELLTAGTIAFPTITVEEIEDRSKGDGCSKTIAVGQILWTTNEPTESNEPDDNSVL